jgi:hypothetical protein
MNMMNAEDHIEIQQLVNRYPYYLDAGMFDEMGTLFADAEVYTGGELAVSKDGPACADLWRSFVRLYPNGTPRTRHLIVNLLIEPDGPERARAHSSVLVVQAPGTADLKLLTAGDYLDRFEKVDDRWRFAERRVGNDLFGDMSDHLIRPMPDAGDARPQRWESGE